MSFTRLFTQLYYPTGYALAIVNHSLPLSTDENRKQRFLGIEKGTILEQWNAFTSECPEAKTVKLLHGFSRNYTGSLGNFLVQDAPKLLVVDIYLEYLDPQAAMWLCKREFAHIKHSDILKEHAALLITNTAVSILCELDYIPWIAPAAYILARKTFGLNTEIDADDFAIKNSTKEELEGAMRFLEASIKAEHDLCQLSNGSNKVTRFFKGLINRLPCHQDRLTKVEESLKSRFSYDQKKLDTLKKDDRIKKLKKYILFKNSNHFVSSQYRNNAINLLRDLKIDTNKIARASQNLDCNFDLRKAFL